VWGSPNTWSGSQFHLSKRAVGPKTSGLQLSYMRGQWTGDVLRLSMTLESQADEANTHAGDDRGVSVPAQFAMEKGGEEKFLAACRKLSASGRLR